MATKSRLGSKAAAETTAQETAAALAAPALGFTFVTEANSPFSDGYSISGEEAALADFMAGPMPENDPLYERYVELVDRKDRLEHMQARFETRKGAESVVQPEEARGMDQLGALVDEEEDQMSLHTKEAYRMFMGRMREPGKEAAPIVGGKRVAAALRSLWLLTGNDNPYADWALLRHEQTIQEIEKRLARQTQEAAAVLAEIRKKGLNYSILQSAQPQALKLGYRSPYGYAVSGLIVEFDYYVRLQKTLARKNLRSDDEARRAIADITRSIRSVFNETTRFDRWLTREEIRSLSRADFVPDADEQAVKRVEFVSGIFGMVPAEVYTGRLQPRHSRRRLVLSTAERQLLQSVGKKLEQVDGTDGNEAGGDAREQEAAAAGLV